MLSNRTLMTFHDRGEIVEESSSLSIVVALTVPGCTRSGSLAELTARESRSDSTMWINNVSFDTGHRREISRTNAGKSFFFTGSVLEYLFLGYFVPGRSGRFFRR